MQETEDRSRQAHEGELAEKAKTHIAEVFHEEIVPKLRFMNARSGTLNCEFAGEQYRHWNIIFKDVGSDFVILDFEYDEEGRGLTLYG
jgi:hypothetical protein